MAKQVIRLTEGDLHNIIKESVKHILKEDKRTDQAKKRCLEVIRNHFGNASWLDTVFEHQDNPDGLTHLNYMFKQFMETFYHNPQMRSSNVMRLAPLFCKLAFEANFQNNNPDNNKLQRLNAILNHIYNMGAQGKIDVSKIGLDTTYEQLNDVFGSVIDNLKHQEDERIANTTYERNDDYEIIGPIDYDTAHEYGNQSCPSSKLCYTQSQGTWEQYTADGNYNVYVCLKKGWENIEPIHDGEDDSQYDTYGLSMIFIFIDETGDLAYCNTRWNHEGSLPQGFSVDHAMSKEMLSKLLGAPFNSVFKPSNNWQMTVDDVMKRLANGEDPHNIFNYVKDFSEDFAVVKLGKKWNFINTERQLLSPNQWFDSVRNFKEGFAVVKLNEKGWNFINKQGKILNPNEWFDNVDNFSEGFAAVYLSEKNWNFINREGQIAFPNQWFIGVNDFKNGYARVRLNRKGFNWINTEGQFVSKDWFDVIGNFSEGFANAYLIGKGWNFINTKGQLVFPNQWFDYVDHFSGGFVVVRLNGIWHILDTEGNLYDKNKNFIRNLMIERRFYKSSLIENYNNEYKINNNMKKQLIRLTEGDLHNIIKESVKRILSENGDYDRMMTDPLYALQNNTDDLNAFHKNQSLNKPSVEDENDKQWLNRKANAMEKDDERLLKWATQNCRNVGRDVYFKGLKDFDRKHQYNGRRPDGEKLHSRDSLNRDLRAMGK